jgi:hypothetical protein
VPSKSWTPTQPHHFGRRGALGLEAVVRTDDTRPTLLVRDGAVDPNHPLAGDWACSWPRRNRPCGRGSAQSVGSSRQTRLRITLRQRLGGGRAGAGLVLTNLHVVEAMWRRLFHTMARTVTGFRILDSVLANSDGPGTSLRSGWSGSPVHRHSPVASTRASTGPGLTTRCRQPLGRQTARCRYCSPPAPPAPLARRRRARLGLWARLDDAEREFWLTDLLLVGHSPSRLRPTLRGPVGRHGLRGRDFGMRRNCAGSASQLGIELRATEGTNRDRRFVGEHRVRWSRGCAMSRSRRSHCASTRPPQVMCFAGS